jgi:hypothetical protein
MFVADDYSKIYRAVQSGTTYVMVKMAGNTKSNAHIYNEANSMKVIHPTLWCLNNHDEIS